MSTTVETKEQVIAKIKEIVSNEKFKLDAYFLCGCPSGTPNQTLLKACESYLETVETARPDPAVTEKMIAELEAALAKKSKVADNLTNADAEIREVLDHRALLLS